MPQIDGSNLQIPSIYGQMIQRPAEMAQSWETLKQQQLNNRLLGQNVAATEAERAAAADAIEPDGSFNPDKYVTSLGKRKARPEAIAFGQEQRLSHLRGVREQLGITEQQGKVISNAMLPFVEKFSNPGPDGKPVQPTEADFANTIRTAISAAGPGAAADRLVALYQDARGDPMKMMEAARTAAIIGNPSPETMNLLRGPAVQTNLGPKTVTTQTPGIGGPTQIRAEMEMGLPPATLAELVEVTGPDGAKYKVPRAALGGLPGSQGASAPPAGGGRTGRYPGGAGPSLPAGAPAGAVAAASLPPGVAESQTTSMNKSAEVYQTDVAAQRDASQRIQGLQIAQSELAKAPTGKGAEPWQDFRRVAMTLGLPMLPEDEGKTISYAKASKYLQDYANRRGASMGLGTDAARALVSAANPGVDTPNPAARDMVQVIIGLERMGAAQVAAAQAAGVKPGDYTGWAAQWNRKVDPWGFAADQPSAAKYFKTLNDQQKQRYFRAVADAINAGMFTLKDVKK